MKFLTRYLILKTGLILPDNMFMMLCPMQANVEAYISTTEDFKRGFEKDVQSFAR